LKILTVAGYITIAFWLTHIVYLYPTPFQDSISQGIYELMTEVYEEAPEWYREDTFMKDRSKEEVIKGLKISFYISWVRSLTFVITGLFSGYLILKRKKLGRTIAIILFSIFLFQRIWVEIKYFESFAFIIPKYKLFINKMPFIAIYQSIISPIFYLFALLFLLNTKVKRLFIVKEMKTTS
jgi:hypothetical protein